MTSPSSDDAPLPPSIARVLARFAQLGREEKMQALLSAAKKLPPLPETYVSLDGAPFEVPECQTPVRIFPELRDGRLYFHAQIDPRQSPTVAAFLSIVFAAVNGESPATTLAIPADFVRVTMQSIGLGAREVGLEAIVQRLKRHAAEAQATLASSQSS